MLSIMTFSLAGVVNAQSGIDDILTSDELKKVSTDVYGETGGIPKNTVQGIVVLVINSILSLLGVIFLIIILYAGFLWMTAGGNDDQVGKAKKLMTNSIIGIVIIVGAYAISYFVLDALIGTQG